MKLSQKERVLGYIKNLPGQAIARADLMRWGLNEALPARISDAPTRATELVSDGRLIRRAITTVEKQFWSYNMDVIVYEVSEGEKGLDRMKACMIGIKPIRVRERTDCEGGINQ